MPLTTVRIVKNWDFPDLMAQSPGRLGVWDRVRFLDDGDAETNADFVVVLNQPAAPTTVVAAPSRVWAIIQEPPTRYHRWLHRGQPAFARVYTCAPELTSGHRAGSETRYRPSQPALSWHVGLGFDELDEMKTLPEKTRDVSWITSTLSFLPGHKQRLRLIERLRPSGLVDFYGRGLEPIERKWEGLAPYRYAIAYENHTGRDYWSEKLADCLLAGCMPIYVGCTNLADYFPDGSFVRIDPACEDPVAAIRRIVESDLAERNRDQIVEARRRVLHEHQLFPFVAREIAAFEPPDEQPRPIDLAVRGIDNPLVYGMAVWHWKVKPLVPAALRRMLP